MLERIIILRLHNTKSLNYYYIQSAVTNFPILNSTHDFDKNLHPAFYFDPSMSKIDFRVYTR